MEIFISGALLLFISFVFVVISVLWDKDEIATAIIRVFGILSLLLILVGLLAGLSQLLTEMGTNS